MRKVVITLYFIVSFLILCSCVAPANPISEPNPTSVQTPADTSPSTNITTTPTATPVPSQPLEPTPSPEPTAFKLISGFPEDTVIVSNTYNTILFGYADGEWLSHSNAAAYCNDWIDFYGYDLYGNIDTRPSDGVCEYLGGSDCFSVIAGTPDDRFDYNGDYHLIINENEIIENTKRNPVSPVLLLNIPSADMPEISPVKNTSEIQTLVQKLLNDEYGDNAPKASITAAVEADIDGDGEIETVFNAHNLIYPRYFPEDDPSYKYSEIDYTWYSVVAIIESDGQLHYIAQNYGVGFMEDCPRYEAAVIVDIDADGRCEIILDSDGWEWSDNNVIVYDGNGFYWTIAYAWVV